MKVTVHSREPVFPMPVLVVSTFNEDGTVNAMTAAWVTMVDRGRIALNLSEKSLTVANIRARGGFVVHIADEEHIVQADFFGDVSGSKVPDKFLRSGMTWVKSELVDAPVINELPLAVECEFLEYQDGANGLGVIGKIRRVSAEEYCVQNGRVVIDALEAVCFDPFTQGYYRVGPRLGEAFRDGLKLKYS